jgi:hypothetical protein
LYLLDVNCTIFSPECKLFCFIEVDTFLGSM